MSRPMFMTPFSEEVMTVDNTTGGVGFTLAKYQASGVAACWAEGTVESGQVRYKTYGVPTALEGTPVEVGQSITLRNLDEIRQFRAIRTGTTSGTIYWTLWKTGGGQ